MREILFRGKRAVNGKWVTGHYAESPAGLSVIIIHTGESLHVTAESVGQYTGLKDKNGVKIFEGILSIVCREPIPQTWL